MNLFPRWVLWLPHTSVGILLGKPSELEFTLLLPGGFLCPRLGWQLSWTSFSFIPDDCKCLWV